MSSKPLDQIQPMSFTRIRPKNLLSQREHHVPALNSTTFNSPGKLLGNIRWSPWSEAWWDGKKKIHSGLTGRRAGPVGWSGGSRKAWEHYVGFPDPDGSASDCHSWGALHKFIPTFGIFPVPCCWIILTSKSPSESSKKTQQMQLLLDANSLNQFFLKMLRSDCTA